MKSQHPRHQRLAALDGIRGVAAVIVVLSHALLTTTIGDSYVAVLRGTGSDPAAVLLADTPLRYLFMGNEAVVIFFVLSGFVLTLPMLRGRGLDLWAYYPRRVLRLWLPVAASVILAAAVIILTRQTPSGALSAWVKQYSFANLDPRKILGAMMVITGDPVINNPLWSIKWEMLFSLLLPVAFLITLRVTRNYWLVIIAAAIVSSIGEPATVLGVKYMPMFLAGCVVAKIVHTRTTPAPASRAWLMVFGGAALIAVPDLARVVHLPGLVQATAYAAVTVGAAMIIAGLTIPSGVTAAFASRPFRFLGRISFSLYLVHVPILIGAVHLMPSHPNEILFASIPTAFVIAVLFTLYVEEPAARLARRVGVASASLVAKLHQGEPGRDLAPNA
ncbi:acyltransferase [Microbacterium panaciterrae]|uniref:acyltransferase family protein n=1 Tax=Microbacterium panaciterrae TaxID=985759 RepID=UPI0031ECFCB2